MSLKVLTWVLLTVMVPPSISAQDQEWRKKLEDAQHLESEGNPDAAADTLKALIMNLTRTNPRSPLLADAMGKLASLQQDRGAYGDAQQLYEQAVFIWEAQPQPQGAGLAITLNNLGSLYVATGQLEKAEAAFRRSLTMRIALFGTASSAVALCESNLADDLVRHGKYSEAEALAHQAIDIWKGSLPVNSQVDLAYNTLALVDMQKANYAAAIDWAEEALDEYAQRPADQTRLIWYNHTLAGAKEASGDLNGAAQAFAEAFATLKEMRSLRSPDRIGVLLDYAKLLRRIGRTGEARKIEKQADKEAADLKKTNWFQFAVDVNTLR
jgi:tetratricopeptide (TPR) repeat protein